MHTIYGNPKFVYKYFSDFCYINWSTFSTSQPASPITMFLDSFSISCMYPGELVGHSHFQLDPRGAFRKPWDVVYFLKSVTQIFDTKFTWLAHLLRFPSLFLPWASLTYMIFQLFLQNFYPLRNSLPTISATQTYCFSFVILPQHFYRCISNQCPSFQNTKKKTWWNVCYPTPSALLK